MVGGILDIGVWQRDDLDQKMAMCGDCGKEVGESQNALECEKCKKLFHNTCEKI